MDINKQYQVKIFEPDGVTLIETINPEEIETEIKFKSSINSGVGALNITLNRKFDDYGEGSSIKILNVIKVFQYGNISINPRVIYSGFISQYNPFAGGDNEGVIINCLGLVSLFVFAKFTSGANYVFSRPSEDPSITIQAIADNLDIDYPGLITTNLVSVGTDIIPSFSKQTWLQSLQQTFQQTGGGFYWYLDALGVLNLSQNPVSATHIFTIGKDIDVINTEKSSEPVINDVTVFYGPTLALSVSASDAASISSNGTREETYDENGITDAVTAQQFADQKILENKDVKIKSIIRLNTSYDFESVLPGDTCKVRNINEDDTTLSDNMQIISVNYTPDFATLQIADFRLNFGKELQKFIS